MLTGRFSISAFQEYSEQLMAGLAEIAEQEADLLLLGMAGALGHRDTCLTYLL
ncbi:hypothetical protein ABZ260_43835 [Streptosporangium sp. NPDC006013]|uniref:hypothetical protein n=1 Tax=Streptosporangium sp. NPDC006013 TaxID=3155596 RepID=UPI0033A5A872